MELDYALLADAAQVSEGKTSILGGGVTILYRDEYPAPMGVVLALQLSFHPSEANTSHTIAIEVVDADGHPVLPPIKGGLQLGEIPENMPRTLPITAPFVIPLPPTPALQHTGSYALNVMVDDRHLKSLPFAVMRQPKE